MSANGPTPRCEIRPHHRIFSVITDVFPRIVPKSNLRLSHLSLRNVSRNFVAAGESNGNVPGAS